MKFAIQSVLYATIVQGMHLNEEALRRSAPKSLAELTLTAPTIQPAFAESTGREKELTVGTSQLCPAYTRE